MASAQQQTKTDPDGKAKPAQKPDPANREVKAAPPPAPKTLTDWASI